MTLLDPLESSHRGRATEKIRVAGEDEMEYRIAWAARNHPGVYLLTEPSGGTIPGPHAVLALGSDDLADRIYISHSRTLDETNGAYLRALIKLRYASKGGKVDVQSAHLTETVEPSLLRTALRSFVRGIGDIFGVAPIRRPVEEPEEAYRAVTHEIRQATEVAKGRV